MRFVVTQFLSTFWIYQPTAFWHPRFLMRNLLIILSAIPYMWWVTFLLLSRFSLSLDSLIIMCLSVDFLDWFYPTWSSLNSLEGYVHVFHHIWDVFTHYFFQAVSLLLSLSLLGFPQCMCWSAWCCPTGYLGIHFSFLQSFFRLLPQLDNFNCLIFKVADSSAYSNLLLNPSSQFYFCYIFKLQNFFLVYF